MVLSAFSKLTDRGEWCIVICIGVRLRFVVQARRAAYRAVYLSELNRPIAQLDSACQPYTYYWFQKTKFGYVEESCKVSRLIMK